MISDSMRLVVDVDSDDWLLHEARECLENLANRERKLLGGKAPDAEAEAEARAEIEKIRAQAVAARAEAMADQIRAAQMFAAEQAAKLNAETVKGRTLATVMKAQAGVPIQPAEETAVPSVPGSDLLSCRICAARRPVISPAQPGGTRREVPGSDGLWGLAWCGNRGLRTRSRWQRVAHVRSSRVTS